MFYNFINAIIGDDDGVVYIQNYLIQIIYKGCLSQFHNFIILWRNCEKRP